MEDRVDPVGGWFNLGDRKLDELPSSTEARATQPRSSESAGMSPKTTPVQTHRYYSYGFQSDASYTRTLFGYMCIAPTGAAAFQAIDFPVGTKLVKMSLRAYRKDNLGTFDVIASITTTDSSGSSSSGSSLSSTSNGTFVTDDKILNITIQPNTVYAVGVQHVYSGGIGACDARTLWIDLQVVVPWDSSRPPG